MARNVNLQGAKRAKKDEFYTRLRDIENELRHYIAHFLGQVVYCNCDDPRVSNFFDFFSKQFEILGSDYEVKAGLLPEIIKSEWKGKIDRGYIDGKRIYARILIRNKQI